MLKINSDKMLIAITRGDTASIVFSAKDENGTTWNPATTDDKLKFAVSKKYGDTPFMQIENTFDGVNTSDFWTVTIGASGSTDWYQKDSNGNVVTENGSPVLIKFGDYYFDVEVTHTPVGEPTQVDTIIGKTDDVTPVFRVWGEVAK